MRKARALAPAILLVLAGCFHVELVAPHGMDVVLLPGGAPVEVEREWRTWFVVWGYSPLDNTMPEEVIRREGLTEVRVITEDNVPDALHAILYTILLPIGLVPQTLILQGNRKPPDPAKGPIPARAPSRPGSSF